MYENRKGGISCYLFLGAKKLPPLTFVRSFLFLSAFHDRLIFVHGGLRGGKGPLMAELNPFDRVIAVGGKRRC